MVLTTVTEGTLGTPHHSLLGGDLDFPPFPHRFGTRFRDPASSGARLAMTREESRQLM